jgi:hypothetical protein
VFVAPAVGLVGVGAAVVALVDAFLLDDPHPAATNTAIRATTPA